MTGAALETPALEADLENRFGAFVADNAERARQLAWRLVGGDQATAEDIAQEAFVKAYRSLNRFRGDSSLETWFYRILVREAHNYRRWKRVREFWGGTSSPEAPDPSPTPPGDLLLRRRIETALGRLTRNQRNAFVLVHEEGFTTREAAKLLDRSQGTIKTHLHRALQALRRDLEDLHEATREDTP